MLKSTTSEPYHCPTSAINNSRTRIYIRTSKGLGMKLGLGTVQFGLDYGISNKKGQTSQD